MSQFVPMTTEDGVNLIINIDQISHLFPAKHKIYMVSGKMLTFDQENFNILGEHVAELRVAPEEEE